jgi:hypothetical protein
LSPVRRSPLRDGIEELIHPSATSSFAVAYVVLMRRARAFILGYSGVTAIRQLLVTFVGPGRVWIVARVDVDVDDGLRGAQVKALVRGIESGLKHESESIHRIDVVPIGGAQAVST